MAQPPVRPPLGLPRGSVRALLTLMIVAVVVVTVGRGHEIAALWTETLLIALAGYFTSRHAVIISPEVVHRLESEGVLQREPSPLFLPKHSIRLIIVLAFVGLAIYLLKEGRLFSTEMLPIFGLVFPYLGGVLLRSYLTWQNRGRQPGIISFWEDIKAIAVLLALAFPTTCILLDRADLVPNEARNVILALVLFYFGSR